MQLTETNIHVFLSKYILAIKDGFRMQRTNHGSFSYAFLYELKLFENAEVQVEEISDYKIVIQEYDANTFLLKVQQAVLNGFEVDLNSLVWDSFALKRVDAVNPNHVLAKKYTRDELTEMDWEEFKKICAVYEIKGRQRVTMVNLVLNAQEETND